LHSGSSTTLVVELIGDVVVKIIGSDVIGEFVWLSVFIVWMLGIEIVLFRTVVVRLTDAYIIEEFVW